MPAVNLERRRRLTDAALDLVAREGLHGLTHRTLDRHAGEPVGTASNYFPTRDDLVVATLERVWELHREDRDRQVAPPGSPDHPRATLADVVDQLTAALVEAATVHRTRNVAAHELHSEIRRRPELAAAAARLQATAAVDNHAFHVARGLPIPARAVPALQALYAGALLTLLALPLEDVSEVTARPFAEALVHGVRRR